MKKEFFLLVCLFALTFTSCQDETITQMDEVEQIEMMEQGKMVTCSDEISTINYNNGFQLEIVWSLTTTPPVGPPPPPGLIEYEFEFRFGNEITYHYRTNLDQDGSYSEFFYWQLLSRSGQRDGEVRMRLTDCGGSPGDWSDTVKIII